MALQLLTTGDMKAAIGSDATTGERGFLIKIINRTGHTSVKGEVLSPSTTTDKEAILQANEYDSCAIVAEAGVVEGSEMWVWCIGAICQVLYKDGQTPTRGNLALAADTDGRAIDVQNPGMGIPGTDNHFKEIGHCLESKSSGTNVLALVWFHVN